jgi:nucleoside-triphosphatase THEP1
VPGVRQRSVLQGLSGRGEGLAGLLYILTGERGSGKSTVCSRVVAGARTNGLDVAGILTQRIPEGDSTSRRVVDIASGQSRPFGEQPGAAPPVSALRPPAASISDALTPGWRFDSGVFGWANELLRRSTPCDLLVIDELGPLELLGGRGWVEGVSVMRSGDFAVALVVCRPALLDKFVLQVGRHPDDLFTVEAESRDSLPAQVLSLLPGPLGRR